jgi:prevent-host-death family protein
MTRTIPQRKLRNDNAQVIDAVVSGETFVVTRNGVPVAELGPVRTNLRCFVQKGDLMAVALQSAHVDYGQFRTDLDGAIDQRL